jgi:exodeoxyribonuclease V gamma subunit
MADIGGLVDELVAEAERRGVDRRPPDLAEIDVQLEDGTRVVGSVPLRLAGRSVGPARLQYTAVKPHHHLAAWLDLMVLLGSDPGDRWRSLVVGRSPRQGQDLEIIDLEPAPTLADPGDAARTALAVVVDCYRRGMREPLPIFRTLSRAVHLGSARPSDWQGHEYRGDARKAAVDLCFGDTDFDGIMGLPARPGDPSGRGGRVERYAHYLWDSVEATAVSVDPPEAGDPASEGVTG